MHDSALSLLVLLGGLLAMPAADASAVPLRPPAGYTAATGTAHKTFECPAMPPPFVAPLDFPSRYQGSRRARDQVNEKAEQQYKALIAPIRDMEKGVSKAVDVYMVSGNRDALDCALSWYTAWAHADALMADGRTHTGRSMRKWALASLSSAWLKLEFSESRPLDDDPRQAADIQQWLGRIADHVMQDWDTTLPVERINNHFYWAAWAVMATSVVNDRHDQFDWAVSVYDIFTKQVDRRGDLPNEIRRKTRAAEYQLYAVTPLAMIAAFGKANGVDLAARGDHALTRAVEEALLAFRHPEAFEEKAGARQMFEAGNDAKSKLAWLQAYCWTVSCGSDASELLLEVSPVKNTRLGGNLSIIYGEHRGK